MIPFLYLLNEVKDLAGKYPGRKTEGVYWDWIMGQPGCIVGAAFHKFHVNVPLEWNRRDVSVLDWAGLGFTEPYGPQLRWLLLVQMNAKDGLTWADSVAAAHEVFPFVPQVVA